MSLNGKRHLNGGFTQLRITFLRDGLLQLDAYQPLPAHAPRHWRDEFIGPEYLAGSAQFILACLAANSAKPIHLLPRRPFREPKEASNEIILVRSGLLALYTTDDTGRRQIVALRYPGEAVLPMERRLKIGVQPVVRSEIAAGDARSFDDAVQDSADFRRLVQQVVQRNHALAFEWLTNCGLRDATSRIAHLICETFHRLGVDAERDVLRSPLTQQLMAQITGQTAVNVNRVLSDLERSAIIRRNDREIEALNFPELKRIAGFDPSYLS